MKSLVFLASKALLLSLSLLSPVLLYADMPILKDAMKTAQTPLQNSLSDEGNDKRPAQEISAKHLLELQREGALQSLNTQYVGAKVKEIMFEQYLESHKIP